MINQKKMIENFCNKVRMSPSDNQLIALQDFKIDNKRTGYLYAYKDEKYLHIDVGVSIGTPCFRNIEDAYCSHTLHEYLYVRVLEDKDITFESRIENLMRKVVAQLDILRPHHINSLRNNLEKIL